MTADELAAVVRGIVPVVREVLASELADLMLKVKTLEALPPPREGRDGPPGRDGLPGPPGAAGADGIHGTNGQDGLGFDDFEELYDGERTIVHRYRSGERVKEFTHRLRMEIYRGVYTTGKSYDVGDCVTWNGSEWHCNEVTAARPGDGIKAWTLKVKHGRDAKGAA